MKARLETRSYTNFVLTVIALLLAALTVREYGIPLVSNLYAQDEEGQSAVSRTRAARTSSSTESSIPQQQDMAVAGATSEVAAANREIAQAIRELAKSVDSLGASMKSAGGETGAVTAKPVSAAPVARPTGPAAPKPVIQVGPRK